MIDSLAEGLAGVVVVVAQADRLEGIGHTPIFRLKNNFPELYIYIYFR